MECEERPCILWERELALRSLLLRIALKEWRWRRGMQSEGLIEIGVPAGTSPHPQPLSRRAGRGAFISREREFIEK